LSRHESLSQSLTIDQYQSSYKKLSAPSSRHHPAASSAPPLPAPLIRFLEYGAAGSDVHLYASLHLYIQTLLTYGEPSLEEEQAQERVNDAHVVRYGIMAQEHLGKLSAVRFEDVIPMYQDQPMPSA
jgi:hypothetical protein